MQVDCKGCENWQHTETYEWQLQSLFNLLELKINNGVTDACSTAKCWPLLMMTQSCPGHSPDDAPDMPQMRDQTCPRWYPRWCPRHAPDMPQMMPRTSHRCFPRHQTPVPSCTWLNLAVPDFNWLSAAVPGCTWLCLGLPRSTFPQTDTYCHWLA